MRKYYLGGIIVGALIFWAYNAQDFKPLLLILVFGIVLFLLIKEKLPISGKFNATPLAQTTTNFDAIGGQDTAKREIIEALEFLKNDAQAELLGIRPIKGILLSGPPGTGKTLLAKAAASHTSSVFLTQSGSEFIEMYAGVGASRVRTVFANARKLAKKQGKKSAIIFIDEIEILGGKRGSHNSHHEYDQTLNQLLVEMDGIKNKDDIYVLVIGATNREDMLDPAILRPGRFDRSVKVDLPDKNGRMQILKIHTTNKPLAENVDLEKLALETFGLSGAHLESVTNEAAIYALRTNSTEITFDNFKDAVDKVLMGEKIDRKIKIDEKKRIAYHEAGHAVMTQLLFPGTIAKVTVTGRGKALGFVRHNPQEDNYVYTRQYFHDQMAVFLAGAISEEIILGDYGSGATNDFQNAWSIGKDLVRTGLSKLGIVPEELMGKDNVHLAISKIIEDEIKRATAILEENCPALKTISEQLLLTETINGDDVEKLLQKAS